MPILVKCCLNGGTSREEHPAVPLTPSELAAEARSAVDAGAGALHLHARGADGAETLDAELVDAAVLAVRDACPGVPGTVVVVDPRTNRIGLCSPTSIPNSSALVSCTSSPTTGPVPTASSRGRRLMER